jgi:hypothetical protein
MIQQAYDRQDLLPLVQLPDHRKLSLHALALLSSGLLPQSHRAHRSGFLPCLIPVDEKIES